MGRTRRTGFSGLIWANLLLLGALVFVLALQSSAIAGQNCGGGVTASGGVDCGKAKRIAKEFKKTHAKHVQGYTCKAGRSRGTCTLNTKKIVFDL